MKESQRERTKLTAAYINGLAVALFAVGGAAPALAFAVNSSALSGAVIWFGMMIALSFVVHLFARDTLKLLDRE